MNKAPVEQEQIETGVLFVVATPIGNLRDMTHRAVEVLKSADVIACEDTRKSRILFQHWNINAKAISLHKFNEARKIETLLDLLNEGKNIAIITDAGTPAISDPGHRIVAAAAQTNIRVVPIPGASSVITALSVSGMDCGKFVYLGFVPKKAGERSAFFEDLEGETRTSVFFETPQRLLQTLDVAKSTLTPRKMTIMRELTKIHEEIVSGTPSETYEIFSQRESIKGEIVIVLEGAKLEKRQDPEVAVRALVEEGYSGSALAGEAKRRFGIKKSEAYRVFLEISGSAPGDSRSE
jgi:16S rRNA (cytidine1402-2'-O)-methyltransferase